MREARSVLWWEAPGSGAGTEGQLLLPPVRGVMRGNRAWRRREAAWAAGRGVWRSLDKEMMKRERYIYQGGGDGWEGVKRTNCSTTTTGNTALLTHPEGRADPSASLVPRQYRSSGLGVGGTPAPDRTRVPELGIGWLINKRHTGSKGCRACARSFCGAGEGAGRRCCFFWPRGRVIAGETVPAVAESTIPAKSSSPAQPGRPVSPPRPARGQQHQPPHPHPRAPRSQRPELGCGADYV